MKKNKYTQADLILVKNFTDDIKDFYSEDYDKLLSKSQEIFKHNPLKLDAKKTKSRSSELYEKMRPYISGENILTQKADKNNVAAYELLLNNMDREEIKSLVDYIKSSRLGGEATKKYRNEEDIIVRAFKVCDSNEMTLADFKKSIRAIITKIRE